jgi:hypothetical protein
MAPGVMGEGGDVGEGEIWMERVKNVGIDDDINSIVPKINSISSSVYKSHVSCINLHTVFNFRVWLFYTLFLVFGITPAGLAYK